MLCYVNHREALDATHSHPLLRLIVSLMPLRSMRASFSDLWRSLAHRSVLLMPLGPMCSIFLCSLTHRSVETKPLPCQAEAQACKACFVEHPKVVGAVGVDGVIGVAWWARGTWRRVHGSAVPCRRH